MKTKRFVGPLCVSMALFALPAAAQTPDLTTPAREPVCDSLVDNTPGLYGLCVAMCEAQDCKATQDEAGNVVLSPSCNASTKQLLANYIKLADPSKDPPVPPCVEVACPCWSEVDIENMAKQSAKCYGDETSWMWFYGGDQQAYVTNDYSYGFRCIGQPNPDTMKDKYPLSDPAYKACLKSVLDECTQRGLWP